MREGRNGVSNGQRLKRASTDLDYVCPIETAVWQGFHEILCTLNDSFGVHFVSRSHSCPSRRRRGSDMASQPVPQQHKPESGWPSCPDQNCPYCKHLRR